MSKLKLVKGLSYTGHGVSATDKRPIIDVPDKSTADELIASGYFTLIAEDTAPAEKPKEKAPTDKPEGTGAAEKSKEKVPAKKG